MKLSRILKGVEVVEMSGPMDPDIAGIASDSRQVQDGFLFVAIPGHKADGHLYVEDSGRRGARAVMFEKPPVVADGLTQIKVSETRRALAQAAANFHANPSKSLGLVGVTGTNGKTTVSHLVHNIVVAAGWPCGMLGTIEYRLGHQTVPADRTTPDPILLNSFIARMVQQGCRYAVMEVSSHSLDQHRVTGLDFDVTVFTNLTRDHLDYHGTKEDYLRAKASLFQSQSPQKKDGFPRMAVVCVDQPEGRHIAEQCGAPILTYGLDGDAEVTAEDVRLHASGSSFTARTPWGSLEVESCLLGRHNVSNILAALSVGLCQGFSHEAIQGAVSDTFPIPGRLEFVPTGKGFSVVVDYAHTDDALKNVLTSLREITEGRLIVVFGCGGDRDRGKRPKLGEVASRLADFALITSDNPRSEGPMEIISEIVHGLPAAGARFLVVPDRREAIAAAISLAKETDTVVIAGKGHETYQEFDGYRVDFDDREVARDILGSACGKD